VPDRRRLIGVVLVLLGVAVPLYPELFGLAGVSPFTQLVAFRPQGLVLVALLGVLLAVRRSARVLGSLVLLTAVVAGLLTAPRAFSEAGTKPAEQREQVVLAANLLGGGADLGQVAALIRAHRPVFVSLPEATEEVRRRLEAMLPAGWCRGYTAQTRSYPVSATSVLVARSLGDVRFLPGGADTEFGNVTVTAGDLRWVAFHPHPPLPSDVGTWRRDLAALRYWCGGSGRTIVAGDFNATLDHAPFRAALGDCRSVAAAVGRGLDGTWPAGRPAVLRTQIDHVVVTPGITPRAFSTHHIDGTDHRAVLATIAIP
jgi:endonuclease/exonuclease/phosphatase (EEP) superfamily protein YafD